MPADATPAAAPALLAAAWSAADALFDVSITRARALDAPIALRRPFIFYLGHLPAFALNTARRAAPAAGRLPPPAPWDDLFSRGIDPAVDDPGRCHAHPGAPGAWPAWDAVVAYRDAARAAVVAARLPAGALRLIAEHDLMHVETLCYMLAQAAGARRRDPPPAPSRRPFPRAVADVTWLPVPAGVAALGRARGGGGGDGFGWDNEFPAATVAVAAFDVARLPVTVAQFAAFVAAGGYADAALWTAADWAWVRREGVRCPGSWRPAAGGAGWDVVTVDGAVAAGGPAAGWPAAVCLAEARAYARWAGGGARLLSEAEWDRAVHGGGGGWPAGGGAPAGGVHGNFGGAARAPVRVGAYPAGRTWAGVDDAVGNGWELVSTAFAAFPGFRPGRLYPEYSADFFDGDHFVLKGASWATDAALVRRSMRNFYQARYRYVFSKFRLARDAAGG